MTDDKNLEGMIKELGDLGNQIRKSFFSNTENKNTI
jgi:hypothetical protein